MISSRWQWLTSNMSFLPTCNSIMLLRKANISCRLTQGVNWCRKPQPPPPIPLLSEIESQLGEICCVCVCAVLFASGQSRPWSDSQFHSFSFSKPLELRWHISHGVQAIVTQAMNTNHFSSLACLHAHYPDYRGTCESEFSISDLDIR